MTALTFATAEAKLMGDPNLAAGRKLDCVFAKSNCWVTKFAKSNNYTLRVQSAPQVR